MMGSGRSRVGAGIGAVIVGLLIAGCSAPPAAVGAASLKTSCDNLAPVMHDFGAVTPDKQRYTDYLPKVQAVADAGDAETKAALADLLAGFKAGSEGSSAGWMPIVTASANLVAKCTAAGSTAYAGTSTSALPESDDDDSDDPSAEGYTPTEDDFLVDVKVKKKKCYGSAGCLITFRIDPTYTGDDMAEGSTVEVTYKVKGVEGGYTNTFTMDSDGTAHIESSEDVETASSKTKLEAVVTDVDYTP